MKYRVTIPYWQTLTFEVDADNEYDAINKCDDLPWESGKEQWQGRDNVRDIEVEEI